ncbi:uncharacterized protein LOC117786290 [Drosophila innubila]|uniref:uncharacterized protein LOC117786290 n=1 Tax=Drosophila innubila TaxID=198719 RepID=UPI00148DD641|nr:uncharacterized protein LOC117786290 [Drosophila innubila]
MLNWQSLIFILPGFLAYTWPGNSNSSDRNELFVLGMHNHTAWAMTMWQDTSYKPDSYCLLWLKELQSSHCPFVKLLVHCVIALPVYNLLLILIGWHLNKSASSNAERILLVFTPVCRRPAPSPPILTAAAPRPLPPLPPPRCKRRLAPKAPSRRMRSSLNSPDRYPSQKDPFATAEQVEQYKSLRRNLIRVLEGLQQPVPAISQMPLPLPMPVAMPASKPYFNPRDSFEEPIQSPTSEQSKGKKKSRKWFHTVVKRLGKTFAKNKNHNQIENSEVTTSSSSSNRNSSIIQMGWKRLKIRASRRSQFYVPSASSSETISSASCIYAY